MVVPFFLENFIMLCRSRDPRHSPHSFHGAGVRHNAGATPLDAFGARRSRIHAIQRVARARGHPAAHLGERHHSQDPGSK